ncbi:hypothetical protein DPMN_114543 [Dreissena polymorpha]|uniref:Uncharacterized protein n=1 Tax=Dreissena polymorpha TaxID=45954 RepID=A0A9D4KK33_DREPO|nr:hypothetical protein DPMN_114543 [Dreissena polymorpha]
MVQDTYSPGFYSLLFLVQEKRLLEAGHRLKSVQHFSSQLTSNSGRSGESSACRDFPHPSMTTCLPPPVGL